MPRPLRKHVPGTLYHVYTRGNHQQTIFGSRGDYQRFQKLLPQYLSRHAITLYAHCLMPNHFHLLLRVNTIPLGTFMQGLELSYAKWWNLKYRQHGHLYQSRYQAIICDRDEYLKELARYIHLNPQRAGLVESARQWPWSSYSAYVTRPVSWITTTPVLEQFDETLRHASARFLSFMDEAKGLTGPTWKIARGRYIWPEPATLSQSAPSHPERSTSDSGASVDLPSFFSEKEILHLLCTAEECTLAQLQSPSRARHLVAIRSAVAIAVWQWWGWDGVKTATLLGLAPSSISRIRSQYLNRIPSDMKERITRWKSLLDQQK